MDVGGALLTIGAAPEIGAFDINDTSLLARISLGEHSFLFAGDLTGSAERLLIESGVDIEADVLKVGHHGSRDASTMEFLEAVGPEVAVISAGQGNPYNFPHAEALARIRSSGARLIRTDISGAVTISTDGEALDISRFTDGG